MDTYQIVKWTNQGISSLALILILSNSLNAQYRGSQINLNNRGNNNLEIQMEDRRNYKNVSFNYAFKDYTSQADNQNLNTDKDQNPVQPQKNIAVQQKDIKYTAKPSPQIKRNTSNQTTFSTQYRATPKSANNKVKSVLKPNPGKNASHKQEVAEPKIIQTINVLKIEEQAVKIEPNNKSLQENILYNEAPIVQDRQGSANIFLTDLLNNPGDNNVEQAVENNTGAAQNSFATVKKQNKHKSKSSLARLAYKANKKIKKTFSSRKRIKIDPVKCFAWNN